jgi:hypothetical protein
MANHNLLHDLTGKPIGNITVLHRIESLPNRESQWLCRCACGREFVASTRVLLRRTSKHCTCEPAIDYSKKWSQEELNATVNALIREIEEG